MFLISSISCLKYQGKPSFKTPIYTHLFQNKLNQIQKFIFTMDSKRLEIGNLDNIDLKTFKNYLHSSFVH